MTSACLSHARQSSSAIFLQTLPQQVLQLRGRCFRQRAPVRFLLENPANGVRRRISGKCLPARHHLEQHAAERPHVGTRVDLLPARLFGTHVRRRPEDGPDAAFRPPCVGGGKALVSGRSPAARFRQPEVEHFHDAGGRHLDIGRLEIAMDDALVVRRLERFGDLPRHRQRIGEPQRTVFDPFCQRVAFDQLEHQRLPAAPTLPVRRSRQCGDD